MIYEYRVYEAMPGKLPDLHRMFQDHSVRLFDRHGFTPVGFWTPEMGEYNNRLVYLLAFKDLEARQAS